MSKVYDNKFIYEALIGFNDIHERLRNNPPPEEQIKGEIEELVKEVKETNFKFKGASAIQADIEKQSYALLLKLQSYSSLPIVHDLCVKYFLLKGKFLLALKSLLFLHTHHLNSFEYIEALNRVINYIRENKEKVNPEYLQLGEMKKIEFNEKALEETKAALINNEKDRVRLTEYLLRFNKLFKPSNSYSGLISTLLETNVIELRSSTRKVSVKF